MKTILFDLLDVELPGGFEAADDAERAKFFGQTDVDETYIDREHDAVLGIQWGRRELAVDEIEGRIGEYQQAYARMAPGFTMGEMRLKDDGALKVAVLSFKSNALTRDLLNMVAVSSVDEKELFIMLTCALDDALRFMPAFVSMVESMRLSQRA